jgi:hypothetical protein
VVEDVGVDTKIQVQVEAGVGMCELTAKPAGAAAGIVVGSAAALQ